MREYEVEEGDEIVVCRMIAKTPKLARVNSFSNIWHEPLAKKLFIIFTEISCQTNIPEVIFRFRRQNLGDRGDILVNPLSWVLTS